MIEAVIFDLDDTLYEEKQFVMSGFKKVAEYLSMKFKVDLERVFEILREDFEKGIRGKNFNLLLEKLAMNTQPVEELIKIYRQHFPSISLYPDARFILNFLNSRGIKIGLITDGYPSVQRKKICALGIEHFFDVIVINDIGKGFSKKNKVSFKKALSVLKVKPENVFYVGDNPLKDFSVAKKLGINTVRVKRKKGEYADLSLPSFLEANYEVFSLEDLADLLNLGRFKGSLGKTKIFVCMFGDERDF